MSKKKKNNNNSECFDEFDYIYYEALDKYLKKDSYIDNISEEDLPF